MNKSKFTLLIALILCVAGLLLLAGCGGNGKNGISEIYITKADAPRLSYVEGQELDLTDGKLTVVVNGKETKLPLTSPDITVSGYDKNQLGDQTVTFQYGEFSATVTVNVIKRAVAENYETQYFVGDVFNPEMGKIQIATDDAKIFSVNMNDSKISLISFDSSKAGTATVTVLYNDSINSYYCQFDVTVYEQSNIQFTPPTKTAYDSHDKEINVAGGYFTVTSSDSKLTKNVPLTKDMISSFDFSAATMENRVNAKEQAVTVTYLGKTFNYNISITYSSVSVVNYYAENVLSKIDWDTAKTDGLSDDESEAARDAISEYYKLSDNQLSLISDEVKSLVGRAGAVAVSNLFYKELGNYANTFRMDTELKLYFVCSNYEQTQADVKKLNDSNENINVYSNLLRRIETDFGEEILVEDVKVADFVLVYTEDQETRMREALNHLTEVYSYIADIPDTWTAETLKAYGDNITTAALQIYNSNYYKGGFSHYYTMILSPWRTNNDFFEILYSYFLYDYENGHDFMLNYMWGRMPMPGTLEEWYKSLSSAQTLEIFYANYYSSEALLSDVSTFMYYYYQTLELAEEIKSSKNQLWIDIYNAYNGDYMNQYYMYTYDYGYLYHTKAMIDSEAYHELWTRYYTVLKAYNDKTLSATDSKADIVAMFNAFEALSPSELYGFLSSLNLMYSSSKGILPTLKCDELVYNLFTYVLRDYYLTYFNEAGKPVFTNLLQAMENFVLIDYKDNAKTEFETLMKQVIADYTALSNADKANFNQYAGTSYQKYLALYNLSAGNTNVKLTDKETALFEELKQTLEKFRTVYTDLLARIEADQEIPTGLYSVMYSLYARADEIYRTILETASDEAITALSVTTYELFGGEFSLEKAFYSVDNITTTVLINQSAKLSMADGTVNYVTAWNVYADYGLAGLIADMSDALYYCYYDDSITLEKDYVAALMSSVRDLTPLQSSILTYFSADVAYYSALNQYFASVLSKDALNVDIIGNLIQAEKEYVNHMFNSKETEHLDNFISLMKQIKTDYASLSAADKAYLDDMYNYYINKYNELTA